MDIPRLEALNWRVREIDEFLEKVERDIDYHTEALEGYITKRQHTTIERRVLLEEIERVRSQP